MFLNLDSTFKPFPLQEEIVFQSMTFAGGEPHIKIKSELGETSEVMVTHRINSFNDFGLLLLAVDALRRMGVENISAFIPYFPAARQDRVMIPGEPLSVKVYADLLNQLNLKQVTVFDAHSEVTPAVLNHCKVIPNHVFIKKVVEHIGLGVKLVSPDGGALKKIYKVSEFLNGMEVVECSKSRDVKTGQLSGFKVSDEDLGGSACLIVDDICDGGGTFIGLADELKRKNAGDLYLAVSHGIFSKGFDLLKTKFKGIYTTDSFRNLEEGGVVQINLRHII
jgi:ribose-phosphate pyrophosphokinase